MAEQRGRVGQRRIAVLAFVHIIVSSSGSGTLILLDFRRQKSASQARPAKLGGNPRVKTGDLTSRAAALD